MPRRTRTGGAAKQTANEVRPNCQREFLTNISGKTSDPKSSSDKFISLEHTAIYCLHILYIYICDLYSSHAINKCCNRNIMYSVIFYTYASVAAFF